MLLLTGIWGIVWLPRVSRQKRWRSSTLERLNTFMPHMTWWWRQIHNYQEGNERSWAKQTTVFIIVSSYLHLLDYKNVECGQNPSKRFLTCRLFLFVFFYFFFSWHTTDSCDSSSLTCVCVWLFKLQCRWRLYVLCEFCAQFRQCFAFWIAVNHTKKRPYSTTVECKNWITSNNATKMRVRLNCFPDGFTEQHRGSAFLYLQKRQRLLILHRLL